MSYLKKGGIPIITGFQGINKKNRITTIGRGGTDASAIMFAKFFNAEKCIISVSYTHLRAHETPEHLVCRVVL